MGLFSKKKRGSKEKKRGKIIPQVKLLRSSGKLQDHQVKMQTADTNDQTSAVTPRKSRVKTSAGQAKDPGKRRMIFALGFLIAVGVLALKLINGGEWEVRNVVLVAVCAGALAYVGLLIALRFDVHASSYFTVLPQVAFFTFGSVMFLETFFFQEFVRLYQSVLFVGVLFAFWIVLSGVFLMANILNVSKVRPIPLLKVAQTTSYAVTLFMAYFITFSLVSAGLSIYILVPILGVIYLATVYIHLSYFPLNPSYMKSFASGIAWVAAIALFSMLLWPVSALYAGIMPTVVIYIGVGLIMHHLGKSVSGRVTFEYVFLGIVVLLFILLNSRWGFAGLLWQ